HLPALQKLNGLFYPVEGAFSLSVQTVGVVGILDAVQGDSHQKVMFSEEICPFPVQGKAVGLNGVADFHPVDVVLSLELYRFFEKVQPNEGGFPSLKGDSTALGGSCQSLLDHSLQGFLRHKAVGRLVPLFCQVVVKAVTAPQVTSPGGGF